MKTLRFLLFHIVILLLRSRSSYSWGWSEIVETVVSKVPTKTITIDQISKLRVRDIKRRLIRQHGFSADEVARVLNKRELIEMLAFEEHKVRENEMDEWKRNFVWKSIFVTLLVGVLTLCYPLISHLWEVAKVNLIVYSDRKIFETKACWELKSIQGCLLVLIMGLIDCLQLWMTASILLGWFMTSKYFFPIPQLSINPLSLMGGPVSQSPMARYGINVAPIAISWLFRFTHKKLETLVGLTLQSARKAYKKKQRENETPEEKAARKAAKKAAKERAQPKPQSRSYEPEIQPLTVEEIRVACEEATRKQQQTIESHTSLDDID
jgi:hypothetical protein